MIDDQKGRRILTSRRACLYSSRLPSPGILNINKFRRRENERKRKRKRKNRYKGKTYLHGSATADQRNQGRGSMFPITIRYSLFDYK